MIKRRIFLPGLAILIGAVLIGATLGFATTTEPTSETSEGYAVGSSGGSYTITMERFTRHGPETIERAPFQLESSTQVLRYTIEEDRSLSGVSHSIKSSDEDNDYMLELVGSQYTVTDVKTGIQSQGPKVPESSLSLPTQTLELTDMTATLESAGLTRGSEMVWQGRNVVVFESTGPIIGQLSAPEPNGVVGLPVIHDLSPVSQRAGVYVDPATDRVVRTYRYAIDSSGDETLIESLDIVSTEKGN